MKRKEIDGYLHPSFLGHAGRGIVRKSADIAPVNPKEFISSTQNELN
jgi:hypothetical protein